VAQHAAVGHAGGEDAAGIDGVARLDGCDDGTGEADVVDIAVTRIAATAAGVPGGEFAAGQLAVAVGEATTKPASSAFFCSPYFSSSAM
jgi:hypothetical protein